MPHSYSNSRGGGTGSPIEIIDGRDRNRREELARTDPERSSAASGEDGGLAEKGRIELPKPKRLGYDRISRCRQFYDLMGCARWFTPNDHRPAHVHVIG